MDDFALENVSRAWAKCLGHQTMLGDTVRVEAYRRAIFSTARPGDIVVDLGSGTGLLGLIACQAGASRVYAIEQRGVIDCAREICRANGYLDRFLFVHGDSLAVELPERVDLLLSEMLGYSLLEEDLARVVVDARKRFLKPGGRMIPAGVELFLAPCEAPDAYEEIVGFWDRPIGGLQFGFVRRAAARQRYVRLLPPDGILSTPLPVLALDLTESGQTSLVTGVGDADFVIEREGTLHGLAVWFEAQLAPGVRLTTAPGEPPTHWQQTYLPVADPVAVAAGDRVSARLIAVTLGQVFWEWRIAVHDAAGRLSARFVHSNFAPSLSDLGLRMPGFRPELSEAGRVARLVLESCDGQASMGDIAAGLRRQFPDRWPTGEAAMVQVASSLHGKVIDPPTLADLARGGL